MSLSEKMQPTNTLSYKIEKEIADYTPCMHGPELNLLYGTLD